MKSLFAVRNVIERERKNRQMVAVAAYAYEIKSTSIMSDAEFDDLCMRINTQIRTGNVKMDNWFATQFSPHTGQWIHSHPELTKIARLYEAHYHRQKAV